MSTASTNTSNTDSNTTHTVSDRQLAANRANAQKSTGPKTPEGKSRSSQNAATHNLSSTSNQSPHTLVPEPDRQDYAAFAQDLRQNLNPTSPLEELLVERIALLGYKLRLHAQAEARLLDQANHRARKRVERANRREINNHRRHLAYNQRHDIHDDPPKDPAVIKPLPDPQPAAHLLARFAQTANSHSARIAAGAHSLETLKRYESATERAFYKALHQYQSLRNPTPARDNNNNNNNNNDQHHHFHYHRHTPPSSVPSVSSVSSVSSVVNPDSPDDQGSTPPPLQNESLYQTNPIPPTPPEHNPGPSNPLPPNDAPAADAPILQNPVSQPQTPTTDN
jgi:hypothetical protein